MPSVFENTKDIIAGEADNAFTVEEKLKNIIAEELGVAPENIKPESSFVTDLGADSLDLTELILKMEETFGIEISDEDAQNLTRVKDVLAYIAKHTNSEVA